MLDHLVSFSLIVLVFATGARAEVNGPGRYNADGPYAVTTAVLAVPLPNGAFTTTAYIPKAPRPHPVVIFSVLDNIAGVPSLRTVVHDDDFLCERILAFHDGADRGAGQGAGVAGDDDD